MLTDLHMPEMDGYTLTAAVRATENGGARLPIIAITANAVIGEIKRCLEVGMDDSMTKPIQLKRLRAMLEQWLPATAVSSIAPLAVRPDATGQGTAAPQPGAAPVDLRILHDLVGSDAAVIGHLLTLYCATADKLSQDVMSGVHAQCYADVLFAAHTFKSNAWSVGAVALGELCDRLEQAAGAGDGNRLRSLLPQFESEHAAVLQYVRARGAGVNASPLIETAPRG